MLAVNTEADSVCALLDGGRLGFYTGTQPPNPDRPAGEPLAECRFAVPAFKPAVQGTAKANRIDPDPSARATGTATWYRAMTAEGEAVFDGSIGLVDADLEPNIALIQAGAHVDVPEFSYTGRAE